ncbi:MAG: flagellar biosynthetic protein FliO [Pirellulales bacterium]|nr:flagellar biosynthetic protein FliO [Pirellulales bacterium]
MSPTGDLGVVQAGYEAPVGRVAPESDRQQTSAAGENIDRPAGYDGPTLRRSASPGRLPPRGEPTSTTGRPGRGLNQLWTTGAALGLVLGLFLVVMWTVRRAAPKATLPLPSDVVETLGRAPLAGRQHVQLLRCGQKLLLVNVTSEDARTLTEITDPVEVDRLAELCRQGRPGSAAAAFRQVFEQFNHPSHRGSVDECDYETGSYLDDDRASLLEGRDV